MSYPPLWIGYVHSQNLPKPASSATPTPAPIPHSFKTLSITWVGDMVPSDDNAYNARAFETVAPWLEQADLTIGNVEGTFAAPDRLPKCDLETRGCFAFRGDASFASTLSASGFDFANLVNNHALDFGKEGVFDTVQTLQSAGVDSINPFYPTKEILVNGFHVGILGVSSGPPNAAITKSDFVAKTITELKSRNDFVILIMHGGAEGADKTAVPGAEEFFRGEDRGNVEKIAHTAIDAGADLVLGSGPHVLRKIEQYDSGVHSGLIAYSLGNFVGGGKLMTIGLLGESAIFTATLSKNNPPTYTLTSVFLSSDGIPSIDPSDAGKNLIEQLSN
jgi:poly-gamma-glutamate capsule biosynthesis protein CapA/YwtB (metallophosphatase superfamily)